MIFVKDNAVTVYAFFTASGEGETGLTVTFTCYEAVSGTPVVSAQSATELGGGFYYYTISAGTVDANASYVYKFIDGGSGTDQKELPGVFTTAAWAEAIDDNVDAPISTVDTVVDGIATDLATVDGIVDSILEDTGTTLPGTLSTMDGKLDTIDDFLDTEIAAILADTNELQTDWADGGRLDLILDARASQASVDVVDGIVDAILLDTGTDGVIVATNNDKTGYELADDAITASKFDETTAFPVTSADSGATALARTGADGDTLETLSDQIDTTALEATVAALNDLSAADVNAEVDTALSDIHLDHLFATAYDATSKPGAADALLNEMVEDDAGVTRFTANALEEAPTGGSAPTVGEIADAVWDEAKAGHVAAGSFGEEVQSHSLSSEISALNDLSSADVQSAATAALNAYDPPTNAEMEARTLPAADYFDYTSDQVTVGTNNDKTGYGLADDAITAAKFDESTAFPLKADDSGNTYIARTGADGDTLETLSDQIDGVGGGDATAANQATIITHLTDIKGTGFVKDTDSLIDLAHTGADGDTLETISDQLDAVPTAEAIADAVWDEQITTSLHNGANSAGKKLRQLASPVIHEGTAQGGAATYITLDAGASATDGTYDPSLIVIVGGTGIGQCRSVMEYDGATRRAYIQRDWKIVPDNTSDFVIYASAGDTHVNEGVAQGGGASTITLNSLASSVDDTYKDQIVFIVSGTAQDEARHIISYNGTTKVATCDSAWETQPDNTSVYMILPYMLHEPPTVNEIADQVWEETIADHSGTVGSTAEALSGATAPSAAAIADAVWEEAVADHSGTVGSTAESLAAAGAAGDPWIADLSAYADGTAGNVLYEMSSVLTTSNAIVQAATNSDVLPIRRGDTNAFTFILGDITGWTKLWFTVKKSHSDADSEAIIQIDSAAGLVYLNGAAGTALHGTVVVNNVSTGNVTFTLNHASAAELRCLSGLVYDVQVTIGAAKYTKFIGTANILFDVTKS